MTRRELLALLGALATGCGPGGEYTAEDAERLARQREVWLRWG